MTPKETLKTPGRSSKLTFRLLIRAYAVLLLVSAVVVSVFVFNDLFADSQGYAKCPDCSAAFQLRYGITGQHNLSRCRFCGGGPLVQCSKEASGWNDSIPMSEWNWDLDGGAI